MNEPTQRAGPALSQGGFLLALILPSTFLGFLVTAPHSPWEALAFLGPLAVLIGLDLSPRLDWCGTPTPFGAALAQGVLAVVGCLAPVIVIALCQAIQRVSLDSAADLMSLLTDFVVLRLLGGAYLCCSVIAPAHELLHRSQPLQRALSRGLLLLVFADPFWLSHGPAHHRCLGQAGDPSSAGIDEDYEVFFRRSLKAQWQFAARRFPFGFALGLGIELALLATAGLIFGWLAALIWLWLAWLAQRLLEAVNYFQHFGLSTGQKSGPSRGRAWGWDGAVSYFLFFGLTRHQDHHRRPWLPFHALEADRDVPGLPLGYLGTAIWVKNHSRSFRRWAQGRLHPEVSAARQKTHSSGAWLRFKQFID